MLRTAMALALASWASLAGPSAWADECEEIVAQHMIAQALLAAYLVAAAEESGMQAGEINAVLQEVVEGSAVDEFWITDPSGHAYLTNTGLDFTFSPDAAQQPQASAFWPLLDGSETIVVQEARQREIDDRVFKYVGVAGVDKPRSASALRTCPSAIEDRRAPASAAARSRTRKCLPIPSRWNCSACWGICATRKSCRQMTLIIEQ